MRRNLQNDAKDGIELFGTKSRPRGTISAMNLAVCCRQATAVYYEL
jgi:hypothetical protein